MGFLRSIGDDWKFNIIPEESSSGKILALWDPNLGMVIVVYVSKSMVIVVYVSKPVICVIVAYLSSLEVAIWSEMTPILGAGFLMAVDMNVICIAE